MVTQNAADLRETAGNQTISFAGGWPVVMPWETDLLVLSRQSRGLGNEPNLGISLNSNH